MSNYILTKEDTGDQYFHINLTHHILVFIWTAIEDLNPAPSSPCRMTALPTELMAEMIADIPILVAIKTRRILCHNRAHSNNVRLE